MQKKSLIKEMYTLIKWCKKKEKYNVMNSRSTSINRSNEERCIDTIKKEIMFDCVCSVFRTKVVSQTYRK